jgi:hypothetical protein
MSKIKLVIAEGYGTDNKPYLGGDSVIDLNLEVPDTHSITGIIRTDFDEDTDGSKRISDDLIPVVSYDRINYLVGKLLTVVDASFSDMEQRKAVKDLIKQIPWDWHNSMTESLVLPWRKDKGISIQ